MLLFARAQAQEDSDLGDRAAAKGRSKHSQGVNEQHWLIAHRASRLRLETITKHQRFLANSNQPNPTNLIHYAHTGLGEARVAELVGAVGQQLTKRLAGPDLNAKPARVAELLLQVHVLQGSR